jgi:hypothetical protein
MTVDSAKKEPNSDTGCPTWVLTFIGVLLVWVIGWATIAYFYPTLIDRSYFGSSFGAIESLFSGLAFAGVILAVLLQRDELRLQRQELNLTRQELQRTADAHERSEQALVTQAELLSKQADELRLNSQLNGLVALSEHCLQAMSTAVRQNRAGADHYQRLNTHYAEIRVALERITQSTGVKLTVQPKLNPNA